MDITEAQAGDIVSIAGLQVATVNYTVAAPEVTCPLDVRVSVRQLILDHSHRSTHSSHEFSRK
jgi:predicted membrane GTPase involved in stress response